MRQFQNAEVFRWSVIAALAVAVMTPVGLIVYQSLLDGPFFNTESQASLSAFQYVFNDPSFWDALKTTGILSFGALFIAVPLGALLAFILTRTDLKFRRFVESMVLVPIFLSSIVLAFGYTVSLGPSGFASLWMQKHLGFVPWNIYSLFGITVLSGLTHVPHAYLYVSSAMRNLPSDLEEAARTTGAGIWRVSIDVTLPMVLPSLVFCAALLVMLGFEMFGLPLVLGDPNGVTVLTTYIYKLTTLLGSPSYHLMAVVAMVLVAITLPLVYFQRRLLKTSRKYAAIGGKGGRATRLRLGPGGQVVALSLIGLWLVTAVVLPIGGISLRAFVDAWGQGVNYADHLTLVHFTELLEVPSLYHGIVNSVLIATVGGALAVFLYLLVGLAGFRWQGAGLAVLDYSVLLPRALPGLIVGLAFFWAYLFIPVLTPLRPTLFSLLSAYIIVGLSYGLRLIQATLLQVGAELEESARTCGASITRAWRDIVIPIIRPGLMGAWVLIMIIFLREYATGVYLMSSGTEVIGSLIVSMLASGAVDLIAALSFISVFLTAVGLAVALRFGAKIHD
jgi:iron(III) transport system permease protein